MEHKHSGKTLQARLHRYAETEIKADLSHLSEKERLALAKLAEAARFMDRIYLLQVWARNHEYLHELTQLAESSEGNGY